MGLLETAQGLLGSFVPAIGIFNTVSDLISGGQPSAQAAVTSRQAALLSGGTAGTTLSTGTSVGPIGALAGGGFIQAADILAPVAARAIATRVSPVPGFLQAEVAGRGVRTVTRKQIILMTARAANPGATAKKIIRSARECGIELAAATFGLSVLDVCFLIAQPPTRRSRGISAADMRRTKSTVRKILSLSKDVAALKPAHRRVSHARH